jgi:putative oxidoreductase
MGLAGVIELAGGLLIAVGVLTSYAAFVASGEMAFAYFMQHTPRSFWPLQNGGELAVLYCFLFLYIAANGAMPWGSGARQRTAMLTPMERAEQASSTTRE